MDGRSATRSVLGRLVIATLAVSALSLFWSAPALAQGLLPGSGASGKAGTTNVLTQAVAPVTQAVAPVVQQAEATVVQITRHRLAQPTPAPAALPAAQVTASVVQAAAPVVQTAAPVLQTVTKTAEPVLQAAAPVLQTATQAATPVVQTVVHATAPVLTRTAPVVQVAYVGNRAADVGRSRRCGTGARHRRTSSELLGPPGRRGAGAGHGAVRCRRHGRGVVWRTVRGDHGDSRAADTAVAPECHECRPCRDGTKRCRAPA